MYDSFGDFATTQPESLPQGMAAGERRLFSLVEGTMWIVRHHGREGMMRCSSSHIRTYVVVCSMLRFASFPTFLPADHDTLDDYGTALTHGILPGIPF